MDRDIELLADLVGKKSKDLTPADIKGLVGKTGSIAGVRPGMPRTKCMIKAIEIDRDIKFVVLIGRHKIRRHISKFSWDQPEKKPVAVEQESSKIRCICESYAKKHGRHMRSCPIHVLGLDRSIDELKVDLTDIIDDDEPDILS
jgi:hypothetical protein